PSGARPGGRGVPPERPRSRPRRTGRDRQRTLELPGRPARPGSGLALPTGPRPDAGDRSPALPFSLPRTPLTCNDGMICNFRERPILSMTAQKAGRPRRAGRHRRRQPPVGTIAGLVVALSGLGIVSANVFPLEPSEPASAVPATSRDSGSPHAAAPSPSPVPPLLRSVEEEVTGASGRLRVVEGEGEVAGDGTLLRYLVEVEEGLPGDPADFAAAVEQVLSDPRSWTHDGALALQRVDEGPVDFRVTLASPETVDERCAPLQTNGYVSCFSGERAMINQN